MPPHDAATTLSDSFHFLSFLSPDAFSSFEIALQISDRFHSLN
jgi:hypothetical protein